jgi:hypothetical protein
MGTHQLGFNITVDQSRYINAKSGVTRLISGVKKSTLPRGSPLPTKNLAKTAVASDALQTDYNIDHA